jgi:hypothetical protein
MDQFLAAVMKHDPSGLPIAKSVKITENHEVTKIVDGIWETVKFMKFYGETVADASTGQVAYMGAVQEDAVSPLMVRLKVVDRKITEIETIISHGSGPQIPPNVPGVAASPVAGVGFGAPDLALLAVIKPFFEGVVPEAQRSSRQKLIAIANSWFDALQDATKADAVPFAPGCNRIENGNLTTNNPTKPEGGARPAGCEEQFRSGQFAYIEKVHDRRYPIVDQARGLVVAQVVMDVPGKKATVTGGESIPAALKQAEPRTNILNELIKIDGGRIQLVQTVMLWHEPYGTKSGWE